MKKIEWEDVPKRLLPKRLRLIRTIIINNEEYLIRKHSGKEILVDGNTGFCNYHTKEIVIAGDVPRRVMNKTIIHEIIEAMNAEFSIGLEHDQINLLETALEELIPQLTESGDTNVINK